MMDKDISNLLGESVESEIIICKESSRKSIGGDTYINYKSDGMSLLIRDKMIESIFLYNKDIEGYSEYCPISTGKLPYSLNMEMRAYEIICKLGDTKEKGGGSLPIWLRYPSLGIEFTFIGKQWDDPHNPLAFITLFKGRDNWINYRNGGGAGDLLQGGDEVRCAVCLNAVPLVGYVECPCRLLIYCSLKCKLAHSIHLTYCSK